MQRFSALSGDDCFEVDFFMNCGNKQRAKNYIIHLKYKNTIAAYKKHL